MSEKIGRLHGAIGASLTLLCLAVGVVALVWLVETRPTPMLRAVSIRALEVVTETVEAHDASWPVIGYGTVRPKHQVNIVPQVSGKLIRVHQDLAQGKIIAKGDLLFEIDPTVYDARVSQAEAEARRLEAMIARHEEDLNSLKQRLLVAERMLAIEQDYYQATKTLYEKENVGTPQQVAADEGRYLRQKDVVIELQSRLAMIPHLIRETQAQLDAAKAHLEQANFDLSNTKVTCPFEARVESVSAYTSQVVTAHFSIATLTDMEAFEIAVGVDPRDLQWLEEAARPEVLERQGEATAEVVVRSSLKGQEYTWRGFVSRFERVDEATRTARMVVEVRNVDLVSRRAAHSEQGLSLSIGMYCRTELPGKRLHEALLVPRHAIYDNQWVYVFDPDEASADSRTGRLGRRHVPMLRSVAAGVLVDYRGRSGVDTCELQPGERVVVSPLTRPVVGMPVLLRDTRLAVWDHASALGTTPSDRSIGDAASPALLLGHTGLATGIR